jgi:hypothetical protein
VTKLVTNRSPSVRAPLPVRKTGSRAVACCHWWAEETSPYLSVHRTDGNIFHLRQINTAKAICFQWRGSMIDAVFNVAVFASLVLCIAGFGAWAHKRVP